MERKQTGAQRFPGVCNEVVGAVRDYCRVRAPAAPFGETEKSHDLQNFAPVDVERILNDLQLERRVAEKRLHDIDETIAALSKLDGRVEADRLTPRARTIAKTRLTDEQWEEVRKRFEAGEKVADLAAAFDVSVVIIYKHIKKGKWKKPDAK